jgi:hypothetical protein
MMVIMGTGSFALTASGSSVAATNKGSRRGAKVGIGMTIIKHKRSLILTV